MAREFAPRKDELGFGELYACLKGPNLASKRNDSEGLASASEIAISEGEARFGDQNHF